MKHWKLLLLIATLAIVALPAFAGPVDGITPIFSFPNVNKVGFAQYADFQMSQGWENDDLVWFICTDASDLQLACSTRLRGEFWQGLNYAPKLIEMTDENEAAPLYIIIGNATQGPVFSAVPGDDAYSGVWRVIYVTFKPGAFKHRVTNIDPYDPIDNPTGLPSVSDAVYTDTNRSGLPIVVKYPIMAVGPLGGPWYPAIPGSYRIPQGKVMTDYTYTKIIFLPYWNEYCRNPVTKKITVRRFIVPDVFDPPGLAPADMLAPKLGANIAPALGLTDDTDAQPFYWQLGPQPLNQYPIVHACPMPLGLMVGNNFNLDYTPVQQVVVLQRNFPFLPASTVINNEPLLIDLFFAGRLSLVRANQIIDAPILPEVRKMAP